MIYCLANIPDESGLHFSFLVRAFLYLCKSFISLGRQVLRFVEGVVVETAFRASI